MKIIKEKKPRKNSTENWVELIEHIDSTWRKRRNSDYGYPFTGKDFRDIKHFARIFQPWGFMALWDVYISTFNEFNEKTGYSVFQFTRQLPKLVDDKGWKSAARKYQEKLMKPLSPALSTLVDKALNKGD